MASRYHSEPKASKSTKAKPKKRKRRKVTKEELDLEHSLFGGVASAAVAPSAPAPSWADPDEDDAADADGASWGVDTVSSMASCATARLGVRGARRDWVGVVCGGRHHLRGRCVMHVMGWP